MSARCLPLLALLGACGSGDRGPINVLLVSLDSTRRDLLGAYGFESPYAPGASSSPNLDRLAAEGVLLEDAYSTTSWTLPSHVSLFTGQPELVHAVDIDYLRPAPGLPTMAEVLKENGYRTAGFYSGPYLDPRFGFARGFERYEMGYGRELAQATLELRTATAELERAKGGDPEALPAAVDARRQAMMRVEQLSHKDVSSATVVDAALGELVEAAADERPFFLFVHFFDPHYDYLPPEPHDRAFDPGYAGPIDGNDFWRDPKVSEPDPENPTLRVRHASDRDMEHVRALYAGEMAWTDEQIGRLLGRLDTLGLRDSTLVAVTADHGDEFFEHGSIGHRRTLFEEVVQVPMILRLPGVLPAGKRVEGLVSIVDLLPTTLELLDVPAPAGLASASLLPLIRGTDDGSGRAVLGRILTHAPAELLLPVGDTRKTFPGRITKVIETYRRGSIKVTREMQWPETMGPIPQPKAREAFLELRRNQRGEERLRWIDVAAHPDERPGDHSDDFTDPRAREALEEFRTRYVELLDRRSAARVRREEEVPLAGLEGLGYAADEAPQEEAQVDRFVLPPPGKGVL